MCVWYTWGCDKLERSVKDRKQIFNESTADVSKLHNIKLLAVATGGDYRQISSKSGGALCKNRWCMLL